jgi:hypothetical protein
VELDEDVSNIQQIVGGFFELLVAKDFAMYVPDNIERSESSINERSSACFKHKNTLFGPTVCGSLVGNADNFGLAPADIETFRRQFQVTDPPLTWKEYRSGASESKSAKAAESAVPAEPDEPPEPPANPPDEWESPEPPASQRVESPAAQPPESPADRPADSPEPVEPERSFAYSGGGFTIPADFAAQPGEPDSPGPSPVSE